MLLWGHVNPKATIKAAPLSPPQCLWRTWWRVLRSSFLPSVVWSSVGLTWWTLASVSATARIIGLCFMVWMRSALFLLILLFSGVIWSWVLAMKAFNKHFTIFFQSNCLQLWLWEQMEALEGQQTKYLQWRFPFHSLCYTQHYYLEILCPQHI